MSAGNLTKELISKGIMPPGSVSISRPCVIGETFYCVCGAKHSRGPFGNPLPLGIHYRCLSCGTLTHVRKHQFFPAADTGDSTSPASLAQTADPPTDDGGAGEGSPDDARPGGAAAAVRDFDAVATEMIKTAISNVANARLLIGSERGPRPMVQLWNLADDLGRITRQLKDMIVRQSDPRPFAPKPTGRA